MNLIPDQISAFHKASVEGLLNLTSKAFDGAEKLIELNLQVLKTITTENMNAAKQALSAKDAQELFAIQSKLVQPVAEKSLAYGRHVQEIVSHTRAELSAVAKSHFSESSKGAKEQIEMLAEKARTGLGSAGGFVKSAVDAAANAYDSVQNATRQALEAMESNLNAAMATTGAEAVRSPRAAARKAESV